MVLAIFKKDFRLLGAGAAAVATAQALLAIFEFSHGPFGNIRDTLGFAKFTEAEHVLQGGVLAAIGLLIASAVHQDAIPQIDMDWLVRPLRRQHLMAAKMVFFLVGIQLPMLLLDLGECLATGFDVRHALSAALARNLFFLIGLTLPVFAIAAVTRNLVEFIVGIGLIVALIEIQDRLFQYGFDVIPIQPLFRDSFEDFNWPAVFAKYAVIISGTAIVLALQYFRRRTSLSRWILPGFILASFSFCCLPWLFVFGLQDFPLRGKHAISLHADPTAPRATIHQTRHFAGLDFLVPIRESGLPEGTRLVMDLQDFAPVRVDGHDVRIYFNVVDDGTKGPWLMQGREGQAYLSFSSAGVTADQVKNWPAVDLSLDMGVTVVEALGGDTQFDVSETYRSISDIGLCRTPKPNEFLADSPLVVQCAQAGPAPSTVTMAAFAPGQEKPYAVGMTRFGDAPFQAQLLPDALRRVSVSMVPLTRRPTAGLYPGTRIVLRQYRSLEHHKVHLDLRGVRLQDWIPENG